MTKENTAPKKRVKKSVIIKRVIAAVLILAILAGIGYLGYLLYGRPEPEQTNKPKVTRNEYEDKNVFKLENDDLELSLYGTTSQFTLKEKKTGRVWQSNPGDVSTYDAQVGLKDTVATGASKLNDIRSTLIVSYSAASADKDLNNWEHSINKQAYTIEKIEDERGEAIEVHYSVGQIQGVSKIPTLLTEERYNALTERVKNAPDTQTKGLGRIFSTNYSSKTIRELALAPDLENRARGAHVLRLSLTQKALDSEDNAWLRDLIDQLNNASIVPFDAAETQAVIDAHADDLNAMLGEGAAEILAAAVSEDEDARTAAAQQIEDAVEAARKAAEEAAASEEAAEAQAAEENGEDKEEEENSFWEDDLLEMIRRPNVEPVDLNALAETVRAHQNDFFSGGENEVEEITELILSETHEDKKTASDRITDKVADAEMAKDSNAWAEALVDALNKSGAEDFDPSTIAAMIQEADQTPEQKQVLDQKFYIANAMRRDAKTSLTYLLYGNPPRIAGIDYSEEEYVADSEWELPAEDDLTVLYEVTLRYRLDGPDLLVEVPYEMIRYNAAAPITYINVLPMFGAAGPDQYDHGFIFVPEGGGALIRYNNGKLQQNYYTANLYGWDYASKRSEVVSETKNTFPVFGLTNKGGSFICIIEEGSAHASIKADINGDANLSTAFHPNSYNTASAKYHVLHSDQYNVSAKTANMVIMYEKEVPHETIVQRYRFVDSDNYVDMANAYGAYLRDRYPELTAVDASEDMPVSLELIGAIDKRMVTAGLPVKRVIATTTFDQMKKIIDEMSAAGVKELSVKVSGWCNGGISQHVLTGVSVEGVLGGEGGMKALIAYAHDKGVKLYFDGITTFAYDTKLFQGFTARADAARFTTREIVEITPYSQIYYTEDDERDVYYLTRPDYAKKNATNLINALNDRGAFGVAFRDIGYLLSGNYDPNATTTREAVKKMNVETLKEARGKGEAVMIREGYDYAMPYVDIITDMDLNGIDYSLLDQSVPFYQIAIHGAVDYTGPSLSRAHDWKTELLRCAEYGAGLNFTFMYEDAKILQDTTHSAYHGSSYDSWKEEAAGVITRYQTEMAGLNRQAITGHMALPMNNTVTTYADGTKVYVNYSEQDYTLDDGTVIPARDYKVIRPEEGKAEALMQAVFEPNGARNLVNFTGTALTAGDATVWPMENTRLKDGEVFDVIFADALYPDEGGHHRLYVNASSEAVTVSGGLEVPAGSYVWACDDTAAEAIFLPDGSRMYVNYGADPVKYGYSYKEDGSADKALEIAGGNYARVRGEAILDAVVLADGSLMLVNNSDQEQTAAGAVIPAKSWLIAENPAPVQAIFLPDGSRMYVNLTAADIKPGAKTVGALNWLRVTDSQAFDVMMDGDNCVFVNASDGPITAGGTEIPAGTAVTMPKPGEAEAVFLPDGSRMYINYSDALIKSENNSRNINAGSYLSVTAEINLDILVAAGGDLWINSTDADVTVGETVVPAKGSALIPTAAEIQAEVIILPDGSRRYVNLGTGPLQVNGANILGRCWTTDSAPVSETPLPDTVETVRYINLSDAEVTFGTVTVPAGQVLITGPEPAAEATAEAAATEEGGDAQ